MYQTYTADLGETLIHYAEAPGPGAPLVLIHGITGALDSFAPVIPPVGPAVPCLRLRPPRP